MGVQGATNEFSGWKCRKLVQIPRYSTSFEVKCSRQSDRSICTRAKKERVGELGAVGARREWHGGESGRTNVREFILECSDFGELPDEKGLMLWA